MDPLSPDILIDLYLDGMLTDEQGDQLVAWLKQSPENMAYFIDCAAIHSSLRRHHVVRNIGQTRREVLGTVADLDTADIVSEQRVAEKLSEIELSKLPELPKPQPKPRSATQGAATEGQVQTKTVLNLPGLRVYRSSTGTGSGAWFGPRTAVSAIAAMLLLGLVLVFVWPTAPPPLIATLTSQHEVQWAEQHQAIALGHKFTPGRYAIDKGFAELRLARGASLVLEGPCDFELLNDNALYLHHGRLAATAPESAHLFTIDTPHLKLVDLGTEFGVDLRADSGQATAAVFKGLVEVSQTRDKNARKLMLNANQQVTADASAALPDEPAPLSRAHRFTRSIEESRNRLVLSGQVILYRIPPASVHDKHLVTDVNAVIFQERQGVVLKAPIANVLTKPGEYNLKFYDRFDGTAPSGTKVDSYLFHYDQGGRGEVKPCSVKIVFPRPLVAALTSTEALDQTDQSLGHPDTTYSSGKDSAYPHAFRTRGIDFNDRDRIEISHDRRTVLLSVSAERMDQVRFLIESE